MCSPWPDELWLGALDYYDVDSIPVLQIVPEEKYRTLDIPDMSQEWNPESEPVWRWLTEEWNYPVPKKSIAVTNLDALRGKPVTEVVRWEEEEWEMFAGAGPDVDEEDARWVPLGTLIGIDQTLYPAANLGIGKGIWRDDEEMKWHRWESSTD